MTPASAQTKPRCAQCGSTLASRDTDGLCPVCLFDALNFFDDVALSEADPVAGRVSPAMSLLPIYGYTVTAELARGGMGIVYRARQWAPEREVALKMLLPFSAASPELRERFRLEARTLSELDHPAILPIFETGDYDGLPWFSMKLATGGNLAEAAPGFRGRWRDIAELVATVADAVHFAHGHGVLHRDLKPGNILFDAAGRPFVADFGLAKLVRADSDFTRTALALGTPRYLAPEVAARSARDATVASDVYGLGAMLFELLAGRPPFEAEGLPALLRKIAEDEPAAVGPAKPQSGSPAAVRVPRDLEVITLKCLAKNPAHRYGSARELSEELRRWMAGEPILARPVGRAEKLWRLARRQPALAAALVACVVIAIAGVSGIVRQLQHTEAARAVAEQKSIDERKQRALAERSELVMRQNLYAADMVGVQRALDQNDLGGARVLLEAHRPTVGQADLRGFEWRYFWGKSQPGNFLTLSHEGHEVSALAFSPTGKGLAYGSRQVLLHDAVTFALFAKLDVPSIQSLAFLPAGGGLVMGTRVASVVRWIAPRDVARFDCGGRWPNVALLHGGILAVGTDTNQNGRVEGTTALYDSFPQDSAAAARMKRVLPESGGVIAASPDGKLLATGSWRGKITLWNPASGTPAKVLRATSFVLKLGFSPDGRTLFACTHDDGVWLEDLATGVRSTMARGHTARVYGAAISPDGQTLATGSADQTVRLWDIKTGRQRAIFRGHSYSVAQLAWSNDGKILASGGQDGTVRLWKVDQAEAEEKPLAGAVKRHLFSPDGRLVAVDHPEAGVSLHEFPSMKAITGPRALGQPLRFSADGRTLITFRQPAGVAAELARWSVPDLRPIDTTPLPEIGARITAPTLSSDGRWFAAGIGAGQAALWDFSAAGKLTRFQIDRPGWVMAMEFSPDGAQLAASFMDSPAIHLWELSPEPVKIKLGDHKGFIRDLAFSADGRTLFSADTDKFIKIWDVAGRRENGVVLGHREGIWSLDLSPDGRTLVSTSGDRTLRFWNVVTRREVARFEMETVGRSIAFAPDGGALLVSTEEAGAPKVEVWRAPSLAEADRAK